MRKLKSVEVDILSRLLAIAGLNVDISHLEVVDLDDGGMGSIGIGRDYSKRIFGRQVAEYQFKDEDGIDVSVSLNLDTKDELYELDVFKADFSETKCLH